MKQKTIDFRIVLIAFIVLLAVAAISCTPSRIGCPSVQGMNGYK